MARSRSERADLTMPVGRIDRMLKSGNYASRIGKAASVFIAAVLQYLVSELIDVAGSIAGNDDRKRITPRYLNLAIRNDFELSQVLPGGTIAGGGVLPVFEILTQSTYRFNTRYYLDGMRRRNLKIYEARARAERAAAKMRRKKKKCMKSWRRQMKAAVAAAARDPNTASGGPLG